MGLLENLRNVVQYIMWLQRGELELKDTIINGQYTDISLNSCPFNYKILPKG